MRDKSARNRSVLFTITAIIFLVAIAFISRSVLSLTIAGTNGTVKSDFALGEQVILTPGINGQMTISNGNSKYRFFGQPGTPASFLPDTIGNYAVSVDNGTSSEQGNFNVLQSSIPQNTNPESSQQVANENITNDTNLTQSSVNAEPVQYRAVLGKPVRWGRVVNSTELSLMQKSKKIQTMSAQQMGAQEYKSEYYTSAPYAIESNLKRGKEVRVISENHYKNVLIYTNLSDNLKIKDPASIKIFWAEENKTITPTFTKDTNNDGNIDYVEWDAPHLSNQTFYVIIVNKAEHLDSDRDFISDIYPAIAEKDGNWSEPINDSEYVRVRFDKQLTNKNDITIYPREISGNPVIDVYELNGTQKIAEFSNITNNEYNKVILSGLTNTQDTFDLNIVGGTVEFDHIIDPTGNYINVQRNVTTTSSSTTVNIDPIDTATSFIVATTESASSKPDDVLVTAKILNSTAVQIDKYGTSSTSVSWEVLDSNFFSVQRGEQAYLTTDSSINISISQIDLNSSFILIQDRLNTATNSHLNRGLWRASFANDTTITISRGTTGDSGVVSWQVVQMRGATVEHGTANMGTGATTADVTLSRTFNLNNSIVLLSRDINGATGLAYWNIFGNFTSPTNLHLERSAASGTVNIDWFAIEHPFFSVQNGMNTVSKSSAINQAITSVNTSKTFSVASWSSYTGTGTTNANAFLTKTITSTTNLQFQKGTNNQKQDVYWYVTEINLDTTAPNVTIVNPTNKYYTASELPIIANVSLSEMGDSVLYSLDGGQTNYSMSTVDSLNYNATLSGLSDGTYNLSVYANDTWGNLNNSEYVEFSIDTTGPNINLVDPKPQAYGFNVSLPLNYNVYDSGVGTLSQCWWNLDNVSNKSIACNQNTTFNASDGNHVLYFYANDTLGNINEANVAFSVSTGTPAVVLDSPADTSWLNYNSNVEFNYTPTYSQGLDSCTLYGSWGGWHAVRTNTTINNASSNTFIEDLSSYPDGAYLWNVECNKSGASSFAISNYTVKVDTKKPDLNYVQGTENDGAQLEQNFIFVNVSLNETNLVNITYELYKNSVLVNETTYIDPIENITFSDLSSANITYYYNVTAIDFAGNVNSTKTRSITLIDTQNPSLTLIAPTNTIYDSNESIPIQFIVSDANLDTCWYDLNGINTTILACQDTTMNVPEGENNFTLYVNDSLGNMNQSFTNFTANNSFIVTKHYSVQSGAVSVAGQTTASISKIDRKKSFILLSQNSAASQPGTILVMPRFISSTSVSFENYNLGTANVQWQIVTGPDISTQRGNITFGTTDANLYVPINSVNLSSSFALVYSRVNDATTSNLNTGLWTISLLNSTYINLTRSTTGTAGELSWQVVDWKGAKVQNGSYESTTTGGTTTLATPVNLSSAVLFMSRRLTGSTSLTAYNVQGSLSDAQTVNLSRQANAGTFDVEYFVVDDPLLVAQSGLTTVAGSSPVSQTISSVNQSTSFAVATWDSTGGGTTNANAYLTYAINVPTAITFQKGTGSQTQNVVWFATEILNLDTEAPSYVGGTASPISPVQYSPNANYEFNISWTDDEAMDFAWLEFNGTNYTAQNNSYEYYSDIYNLSVGNYTYMFCANDTSNNVNCTGTFSYEVDPAPSSVALYLDGLQSNATIQYGQSVGINGTLNSGEGNIRTLIDGTQINYGISPIYNLTQFNSAGTYNVTLEYPQTQNYTSNYETWFVNVQDLTPPAVIDAVPVAGTAIPISQIEISANVTDNTSVNYVYVNITYPNGTINTLPLVNLVGNKYNASFSIPPAIGVYNINFFANDSFNNINNSLTTNFTATDITNPAVQLVNPIINSNYNVSSNIELAVNATDNVAIDKVFANVTYPNGTVNTLQLSYTSQSKFNTTFSIPNLLGVYNIAYFVNDTSNNINTSVISNFTSHDSINPEIIDVIPTANSNFYMTDTIEISANVSDNIGISSVIANVTMPNGTIDSFPLVQTAGQKYNATYAISGIVGRFNVTIIVNDTSNNNNQSSTYFNSLDNEPPAVTGIIPVAGNSYNDTSIEIGINATDNIAVDKAYAVIVYPNNTQVNINLPNAVGEKYNNTFSIPYLLGRYNITYFANDTTGNLNNSETSYFFKVDLTPPEVIDARPVLNSVFNVSDFIEVSINVSDSFSISQVYANVTYPNGTINKITLNNAVQNKYNNSFQIPLLSGLYNITYFANDSSGNINDSVFSNFTAFDKKNPDIQVISPIANTSYDIPADIELAANASDNAGVSNVYANIVLPNGTVQSAQLSYTSGIKYNTSYSIPALTGKYNITMFVNDTSNNQNQTTTYFNAKDNVSPTPFNLTSPANGTISSDLQPTLSWQQTTEPSFDNYTIIISNSSDYSDSTIYKITDITNTSITISPLNANTKYYWKVIAYDTFSNSREAPGFEYTTDTIYPTVNLNLPNNDSVTSASTVNFNYTPSDTNLNSCSLYDNSGGTFTLDTTNSTPTNGQSNYFEKTLSDGTYLWNVQCTDKAGQTAFNQDNYTIIVDSNPPVINIISPINNSGSNNENLTFTYNVSDAFSIQNCSIIIDGTLNKTNLSINKLVNQTFNINNFSQARHSWSIECINQYGVTGQTDNNYFDIILANNFDSGTTNFSTVDTSSISNLTIEKTGYGKILYNTPIDLSGGADLNSNIFLQSNLAGVNSVTEPRLNNSANITLYNLPYQYMPVVLNDGNLCTDCTPISYDGENMTFSVSHFTNYSATANSKMTIWDNTDPKGGSNAVITDQQAFFFSNYTNKTDGAPITGATCSINFTDMSSTMIYNSTTKLYQFNRSFTTAGNKDWNVSCSVVNFETATTLDNITIQTPGNVSVELYYPVDSVNVSQGRYFNFTVNVSCSGGACQNVNATLDPSSSWWNYSWLYKQPVNLSVASGTTQSDFQVKLELNSSNVGSNFNWTNECLSGTDSKLRFVNGSDNAELSYWVQNCSVSGQNMTVWVKSDKNISTTPYTIYMYYGNSNAANASNGTKTFDFFDDFSGDLSKWSVDQTSGVYPRIESGVLVAGGGTTSSPYGHTSLGSSTTYNSFLDGVIEGDVYHSTNAIGEVGFRGNFGSNTGYKSRMDARSGQGISHLKPPYSGWNFLSGCTGSGTAVTTGVWEPFKVTVNGSTFSIQTEGQTRTCSDTQYASAGEIALQNHYGSYTSYDNVRVRKYFGTSPVVALGSEVNFLKGVIPKDSGTPFYTINYNPANSSVASCLSSINNGESCLVTWTVNSTGDLLSTWEFFALANYTSGASSKGAESNHVNITIINDTTPPSVSNPQLNSTLINQSEFVRLNATVTDNSMLYSVLATIKYPNGTLKNVSMQRFNANTYYLDFNDTLATGIYNFTNIIATDIAFNVNNTIVSGLTFNVTLSPPIAFNLISPINATESKDTLPNLTWSQSSTFRFDNYTILISQNQNLSSPDYTYTNYGISNTSRIPDVSLNANAAYYWRVIAYNIFGTGTNSTQDFKYITDNVAPTVSLNTPLNGNYFTQSPAVFNFTPTETNTLDTCVLYGNFSGSWATNKTTTTALKNQPNNFTVNIPDGTYLWNVYCNDSAGNGAFASSNNTVKIDTAGPVINLISPPNNTFNDSTNNIDFFANATDAMSNLASCNLIIDGGISQTNYLVTNGVEFNFTELILNGEHTWNVNCTDLNGFESSSQKYNISVNVLDSDPPLVDLNYPLPDSFISTADVQLNYTPKDATGLTNCSLFVDGQYNQTTIAPLNLQPNYFNLFALSETQHNWSITCVDNSTAYNVGNSSVGIFTVDLTNPLVLINKPDNNSFSKTSQIKFNYTPSDTNLDVCNLYTNISGTFSLNQTNTTPLNGQTNLFLETIQDGTYLWNVLCNDSSGRTSFAQNNYTINVDTTPPQYFNKSESPASPAVYSPSTTYVFNNTWIDNFNVNTVLFENNFSGILVNNSTTSLGGNIYQFNISSLSVGNYYYKWYANDSQNNLNSTAGNIYVVNKATPGLNVLLNGSTSNLTINQSTSVNITSKLTAPAGEYLDMYMNSTLINNGSSPLENITTFSEPGIFNVTAVYGGNTNYTSLQVTNYIIVKDITPPVITVTYPANNSIIGTSDVSFQYYVSDSSPISNCSIYLNNTINQTNTSVIKDITQTFLINNMSDGNYTWKISCFDNAGNYAESSLRNVKIQEVSQIQVLVNTTKPDYQSGEPVPITVSTKDAFNNSLQSNVITSVIYTNTTNTSDEWLNTSWNYRKPIIITERNNSNLSNFQTNITINTSALVSAGKLNSDCSDLRFADTNAINIPYWIQYGCNTTSTMVWLKLNLTANSNKTIYEYYGNNGATSQSNGTNVFDYYDAGDNSGTWNTFGTSGQTSAQGQPQPSYYAASQNTNYMYKNAGLTPNHVVDFNVRSDGLGNFYFLTSSTGSGQHFRAETRGGNNAGIGAAASWTSWSVPSQTCSNIATNTWYNFTLVIGSTTAQAYINNAACGGAYTFANNGQYIGLIGDGLGATYTTWWDNIRVRKYAQLMPTATISSQEQVLVTNFTNQTDLITGLWSQNFDSYLQNLGNYSITTYAYLTNANGINATQFQLLPDTTPPNITLNTPASGLTTKNTTQIFNWSIYDYSRNATCDLIIDGTTNASGIIGYNYAPINKTVTGFTEGIHLWNVTCNDIYSNYNTSQTNNFTIDITGPTIILNSPVEGYNASNINNTIEFNWTPTDIYSQNDICKIFIDGINVTGNITSTNGANINETIQNITEGTHSWNISCFDDSGNENISTTRTFVILPAPQIVDAKINQASGNNIYINWSQVSLADSYDLYMTDNYSAGFSATPNVTGITQTNYTDTTSNLTTKRYYKISAIRSQAESYAIQPVGKQEASLYSGFNLISSPFLYGTLTLYNGTNSGYNLTLNDSCLVSLWRYSNSGFERTDWITDRFVPATGSENFTSINNSKGYWIETNSTCNITYAGRVPISNITIGLSQGYNLVPWTSVAEKTLPMNYDPAIINTNPQNAIQTIDRYNSSTKQFEVTVHYLVGGTPWGWYPSYNNPGFTSLTPSEGYYFESQPASTWTHQP